ncbi:MAG: tetratricopeptide repeat protein [Thermoanaerobaculia bacterium]
MDRQHRRDLKHDKFVDEVGHLTDSARANQRVLLTIAIAAVALAVVAYGIYFYRSNQESKAQDLLAEAIQTIESPILVEGAQQQDPRAKFKTEAERTAAAEKQFQQIKSSHAGTDAADVGSLYLARIQASRGDVAGARKHLEGFIADHPRQFLVGPARYSLLQLRVDNGEAQQVITEINAELAKPEPILPGDSLLVLLARAYEAQTNDDKAREAYRRIITEFPDSPFALEAQRRVGASPS